MKNIYTLFALAIGFPVLAAAQDFGLEGINSASISGLSIPVPAVSSHRDYPSRAAAKNGKTPKKWTIIALVNGKNNLSEDAELDLNEMEAVGSTAEIDIVVEMGTMLEIKEKPPVYNVRRYHVQKDADPAKITSPVLMDLKDADMGSWKHFAEYISWAKAAYPAQRYMVIVWNHGTGWKSFGKPLEQLPASAEKGISYDDQTGNHITAIEMAAVLAKAGGADVLASDACLMQELATNYELRNYADVIVASEETEPNAGQDYVRFLGPLAAAPYSSAEDLSRIYIKAYHDSYVTPAPGARVNSGTTISAVRAKSFNELLVRVNALADALLASGDIQFAKDSRRKTLKFADPDAKDLGHFAQILAAEAKDPAVRDSAAALSEYIRSEVVIAKAFTGDYYAAASGLAAYLPVVYPDGDSYAQLSFAAASSWTTLIKKMKSSQSEPEYWDDYDEE